FFASRRPPQGLDRACAIFPWPSSSPCSYSCQTRCGRCLEEPPSSSRPHSSSSDSEEDDVAVLDAIFTTFDAELSRSAKRVHRTGVNELVDRRHLGADEMFFEVGVDLARRNRRRRIALARPRSHLGLACREIGDEAARFPNRPSNPSQPRLVDAVAGPHLGLLAGIELSQLGFQAR